jgi:hypothetical protein
MDMGGQLHGLAALPLGKLSLIPRGQEAEWAPEPAWTPRNLLPSLGIEHWVFRLVPIVTYRLSYTGPSYKPVDL